MTALLSLVQVVDLLHRHGASTCGSDAVFAATRGRRLDTLSFLLEKRADIHEFDPLDPLFNSFGESGSPLHAVVVAEELEVAEYLIKMGVKTNSRDTKERTLLGQERGAIRT